MTKRPVLISLLLGVVAATAFACGVSQVPTQTRATGTSTQTTVLTSAGTTAQATATAPPRVTKVVVFVVENHSLAQMKSGMPKVYRWASRYAHATNYVAVTHPSLPNYLAMAGGSTFRVADDANPSAHRIHGSSVFGQALAAHKTARTYADSMGPNCALAPSGKYAVKHNPWAYFVDERADCRRLDVPVADLAADAKSGDLPNVGFVIPNLDHDAHDAALSVADDWIAEQIDALTAGPDWKAGRLLIVVTADEDDRKSGNKVLTVVGSKYQAHKTVTARLTHYSLTRLIEDVLGVGYLRGAADAPDMSAAFDIHDAAH